MNGTAQLRAEHEGINIMLQILEVISDKIASNSAVELSHIERIIEFLQVFADQCHHGKEEKILFPALERAGIPREGGPIGVMLMEHVIGRDAILAMKRAVKGLKSGESDAGAGFVKAAGTYIDLLRNHIAKENNILFAVAERRFSMEEQKRLYEDFERMEREKIGEGRHEAFHSLLNELSEIYLRK
jgi:hemerythrin-like domain-containing protein